MYTTLLASLLCLGSVQAQALPDATAICATALPSVPLLGQAAVEQLRVGYQVVQAHNDDGEIPPALRALAPSLTRLNFTGFRLLDQGEARICGGCTQTFSLAEGRSLTLEHQGTEGEQATLQVVLTEGARQLLQTTIKVALGGTFLLAGPPLRGGTLVLPISVSSP